MSRYCPTLSMDAEGVWHAPAPGAVVSYPEQGHDSSFAIEDASFWFGHRNRCIAALVRAHPPRSGGPIFDIGGGNGFVARGLADAGFEVVLVEPGRQGARNARSRGLAHVVCATTASAGFVAGSLQAVGLFDVIEHVDDDLSFIRHLAGLLEAGGSLYATVPAHRWLWSEEDDVAGHFHRYALGDFCGRLAAGGFEIEFATYFFRWLPLPIALLRALPYRLGVSRRARSTTVARREHAAGQGRGAAALNRVLAGEVARIEADRPLAFGASCLVAARRA